MDRQTVKFRANASRIAELKESGVSERILSRMISGQQRPRTPQWHSHQHPSD